MAKWNLLIRPETARQGILTMFRLPQKIVVMEDPDSYQSSYETFDFMHYEKDSNDKEHTSLTTRELKMKEGKDGFVLFSNQKTDAMSEIAPVKITALIVIVLFIVFLTTDMLYHRGRGTD